MLASPGLRLDRVGRLLPLCGVFALRFGATAAAAEPPPSAAPPPATDVRLELDAAAGCATPDELIARVTARSSRIRFISEPRASTVLRVTIGAGAHGGFVGQLDVAEPDGRRFARRIEAPTCAEATDALALVITITFDPMSALAAGAGVEAAGGPPAAPPPPTPPALPSPRSALPPAPARTGREGADAGPRPVPAPTVRRGVVAAAGEAVSGPAPGAMYGIALIGALTVDRDSIWSPAVSASLAHVSADDFAESGGTAAFSLDTATLDLCPLRLVSSPFAVGACASGLLGRFSARGSKTYSPQADSGSFATVGGAVLLTVALGARFELRGRFGAGASLIRDRFEFTSVVFHRVASVTLVGDLGLGVRFP
jgi:hypothetical protein